MNSYNFRKAQLSDVTQIMKIIKQAQKFLKNSQIDQWQNNYPNAITIKNDINNDCSYLIEINNRVVGTLAIIFDREATYDKIYFGEWKTNSDYVTIHRIAIDNDFKGSNIGKTLIDKTVLLAQKKCFKSIRIDTHRDNLIMQKFLLKNNFYYCGVIYLSDGNERLAYERVIV